MLLVYMLSSSPSFPPNINISHQLSVFRDRIIWVTGIQALSTAFLLFCPRVGEEQEIQICQGLMIRVLHMVRFGKPLLKSRLIVICRFFLPVYEKEVSYDLRVQVSSVNNLWPLYFIHNLPVVVVINKKNNIISKKLYIPLRKIILFFFEKNIMGQ